MCSFVFESRRFDSSVHSSTSVIGETGRPMQERIKEHDRNIRLAKTHTSVVSENAHNTGRRRLLILSPISPHVGWKR